MQKFKDLFYDDLSVARGYFLTLLSAFFITIILLIGFVVSDTYFYGVFIVLIGIVLLRLFKINLLSFKN